jgi:YggT family protein
MVPLLQFIDYVIHLYEFVVIANVILSWLVAFNVVNAYNPVVRSILQAVGALTDPILKHIRGVMPNLGGLDLSPVILLLGCYFLRFVVIQGWMIPFFGR